MKLKAKDLREKSTLELMQMLEEINRELSKWKAGQEHHGIGDLPSGEKKGIRWGIFSTQKKNKARILTILNERGKAIK